MKQGFNYETKTDVVPIINVSLVVVLTLMLISPFLDNSEHPVDLPEAQASEVEDTDNIEITYLLDGTIIIGDEPVTLDEVRPLLAAAFADNEYAMAVVKADRALRYGDVEALIAQVEAADAPSIALATQQAKGTEGVSNQ